jgi:hypothetical protein
MSLTSADLILRALYRIRFTTERNPLSPGSFAYCFPLIQRVIENNGIGYPEGYVEIIDDETGLTEKTTEQTVIAVEIIKFHTNQCKLHTSITYSIVF